MTCLIVNGERIESAKIRGETAAVAQLLAQQMPHEDPLEQRTRAREWAEENLIEQALLGQINSTDPKAVENRLAQVVRPSRAEALNFYRSNQPLFQSPETVRASHIICNIDEENDETAARTKIERAERALSGGRPFSEVADEFSDCPGSGGDLGVFPRGQMVDTFDNVVFNMSLGQTSGIFKTEFGYHIAMVLEKVHGGMKPFNQVQTEIEAHLLEEKRQAAMYAFVDDLRSRADVRKVKEMSPHE